MNFCLMAYEFKAVLYVMRIVSKVDIAFHYIADDAQDRFQLKNISIGPCTMSVKDAAMIVTGKTNV